MVGDRANEPEKERESSRRRGLEGKRGRSVSERELEKDRHGGENAGEIERS